MAPLRGWGPKGERIRGFAPHGHWRTLTFLGALRCDQLTAPCVFDGPINGACFRAYVEQQLVAVLKPGDIVTRVAGEEIGNVSELLTRIAALTPGKTAKIDIVRRSDEMTLEVVPAQRPKARPQR